MKALQFAATASGLLTVQDPHSSLIYDFNGACTVIPGLNSSIWNRFTGNDGDVKSVSWIADTVHVAYTPLRPHFVDNSDMIQLVQDWKVVASLPVVGSHHQSLISSLFILPFIDRL
jgi:hypothetical protein